MIQRAIAGLALAGGVGGGMVFGLLSTIIGLINLVVGGLGFVGWLYLLFQTYQGADPRGPGAVDLSKRIA